MSFDLPMERQIELYRKLVLVREAEEKIREEYFNDDIKTPVHLGIGAEAIGIGVLDRLPRGAQLFGTYRNHVLYLACSNDTDSFFAELYGKESGCAFGKAGSMHMSIPEHGLVMTSAVVSTTIPVAVGAALANRMKGIETPVAVFFGDGAVEEGVFWESINFAALKKLPVLFVCEDNDLAIHTPRSERKGYQSISKIVGEYDCCVKVADGTRVDSVLDATSSVLKQMEEKSLPGFLHFNYFRSLSHVGTVEDFDAHYREKPKDLLHFDPVKNFENLISENGIDSAQQKKIRDEVLTQINTSVERAKKSPYAGKEHLIRHTFVEEADR